jgi:hypothetical protein
MALSSLLQNSPCISKFSLLDLAMTPSLKTLRKSEHLWHSLALATVVPRLIVLVGISRRLNCDRYVAAFVPKHHHSRFRVLFIIIISQANACGSALDRQP